MNRRGRSCRAGASAVARCMATLVGAVLVAGPAVADPPAIYHSPNDDGVNSGIPAFIAPNSSQTLHLYLAGGVIATSNGQVCNAGDGEEVCGFDLFLEARNGVSFTSFVGEGNTVSHLQPLSLRFNGGEFVLGSLGPVKLADLVVDAPDGGAIDLSWGQTLDSSLGLVALSSGTLVFVPEPSRLLLLALGFPFVLILGQRKLRRFEHASKS